jgi:hypothetical protein
VRVGDDFTVPVTWNVTHVALSGRLLTPTLTFAIRNDNVGVPGAQVAGFSLAPSKVDPNPANTEDWRIDDYLFTLPKPVNLVPGKYWIVVRTNAVDPVTDDPIDAFLWQFHYPVTGSFALMTLDAAETNWGTAAFKADPDAAFVIFGEAVPVYQFEGFASPVNNAGALNVAKAGQAIPLKWRLTDAAGLPITNLTTVTITVKEYACAVGSTADQVEEYAAGGSGLQNLGDGYYQLNWKSPASYKGSCKELVLTLGNGATYSALFQFTK